MPTNLKRGSCWFGHDDHDDDDDDDDDDDNLMMPTSLSKEGCAEA